MNKEEFYETVKIDATKIANDDANMPSFLKGAIFRPGVKEGILSLEYNQRMIIDHIRNNAPPERAQRAIDSVLKTLDDIAYKAIYESLHKNGELLVKILMDNAREGKGFNLE